MNNKTQILRIVWVICAILGTLGLLMSAICFLLAFLYPITNGDTLAVVMVSMGMVGLLFSIGLIWAGISGWKQTPSAKYFAPWSWALFLGIAVILFIVGIFVPVSLHVQPVFGALHTGIILFPSLTIMAWLTLAAGKQAALTWRQLIVTLTGGALSIALALPVELIGLLFTGILVAIIAPLFPGGNAEVLRLTNALEQWMVMPPATMEEIIPLISSPVVLSVIGVTLGVITPLIEEFGKTLIMSVMGFWKRPNLTQSFVWGAACGLGFALVEGVGNGALGLGDVMGWLGGVGARGLATAMHMLASGLIGLGWGLLWQKRWWGLPLTYITAVVFHGLWNFNVVMAVGGAGIGETSSPIGYALLFIGGALQVLLILLTPIGLFGIPLWLRRREHRQTTLMENVA